MATTVVAVTARHNGGTWTGEAVWVGDSTLWHLDDGGNLDADHRICGRR